MSAVYTPSPSKETPPALPSPVAIPKADQPPTPKEEGPFRKLVRSLSRSASTRRNAKSKDRSGKITPGLSTSPPPDSYFPRPPSAIYDDNEATGTERHPDSIGARAADLGQVGIGQSAPGVTFAPSNAERPSRTEATEDGWKPAPRRTGSVSRNRSTHRGGRDPSVPLPAGDRQGVSLEDKPLSRDGGLKRGYTLKRAASRAAKGFGFVPTAKGEGEIRTLVLVADGSEEIEVFSVFDVLVRAGLGPVIASISPQFSPSESLAHITLSRGGKILADTDFETLKQEHKDDFDAVIIPGGAKGADRLSKDKDVQKLIWSFYESGKVVGMICAGSLAAKTSGIALGKPITSHPSVKAELEKDYAYSEERVVVADNLITSRGPGTALDWSLAIVEKLAGKAKRDEVAEPMCL